MKQYPRVPAACILAIAFILGAAYAVVPSLQTGLAADPVGSGDGGSAAVAKPDDPPGDLKTEVTTWLGSADRLRRQRHYPEAAEMYQKILAREPYHREARFQQAWCLAAAGEKETFYLLMRDLVIRDARLSVDLLNCAVCKAFLKELRFQALLQEAQSQALD